MRIHRRLVNRRLVLSLLWLAPSTLAAQSLPRVMQVDAAADAPFLVDTGGFLVIGGGAGSGEFELPPATRVDAFAQTTDGWVAAGRYSTSAGGDLLVLRQRGDEITLLPTPEGKDERFRGTPAVLADSRRLLGLAWLEGTRQDDLTVRAAAWEGNGWSEPEVVSPEGPGAQLALRGAVLEDGTYLLVWAAIDGVDDDIWWSLRTPTGWTTPARVHSDNQVPDIQPAVVAVPGGALVAWSGFDGRDYRARVARFDGLKWEEKAVDGGLGVVLPAWRRYAGGQVLMFSSVVPAGWSVIDLDERATVRRRAQVPGWRSHPPLLEWTHDGRPRLRWPHPVAGQPAESREAAWEPIE